MSKKWLITLSRIHSTIDHVSKKLKSTEDSKIEYTR